MNNYFPSYTIRYHGQTNNKPNRISIHNNQYNNANEDRIMVSRDLDLTVIDQGIEELKKPRGMQIHGYSQTSDRDYIVLCTNCRGNSRSNQPIKASGEQDPHWQQLQRKMQT